MAELTGPERPDDEGPSEARVEQWVDESGATVVSLAGEIDVSSVDSVRSELERVLERMPERLVFDLGGLRFMDSSGLALMLANAQRVRSVSLRNPTAIIRRLVESTGLAETLGLEP
jgi:anti-sigma B factor antagonist